MPPSGQVKDTATEAACGGIRGERDPIHCKSTTMSSPSPYSGGGFIISRSKRHNTSFVDARVRGSQRAGYEYYLSIRQISPWYLPMLSSSRTSGWVASPREEAPDISPHLAPTFVHFDVSGAMDGAVSWPPVIDRCCAHQHQGRHLR